MAAFGLKTAETWIRENCDAQWCDDFKSCGKCKKQRGGKRDSYNRTGKEKHATKGQKLSQRKCSQKRKFLPLAEEVNIESNSMAIGSCNPLRGTVANDGSIGVSSYDMNNEDTCIVDNTAARETNNELIKILDESYTNEVGNGGSSDAEGDGYEYVLTFQDGMKEVERERLCNYADEIENIIEVDNDVAFMSDASNNIAQSVLFGVPEGWSPPTARDDCDPLINSIKGEPAFIEVGNPGHWSLFSYQHFFDPRGRK
jgi:hypothetical protein